MTSPEPLARLLLEARDFLCEVCQAEVYGRKPENVLCGTPACLIVKRLINALHERSQRGWLAARGVRVIGPEEVVVNREPTGEMIEAVAKMRWVRSEESEYATVAWEDAPSFVRKAYLETALLGLRAALAAGEGT